MYSVYTMERRNLPNILQDQMFVSCARDLQIIRHRLKLIAHWMRSSAPRRVVSRAGTDAEWCRRCAYAHRKEVCLT